MNAIRENDIRFEIAMKTYKEKWLSKEDVPQQQEARSVLNEESLRECGMKVAASQPKEDGVNQDRVPSDVKTYINCFEDVRAEVPQELILQRREYLPSKGETLVPNDPTPPT